MAEADNVVIAVVVLLIVLGVVTFLEMKYLRKTVRGRRVRAAQSGDLPDQAHNAILTSKAISRTLANSGVTTRDAEGVIAEAEIAYRNRNYRVAIELTDRAKGILKAEKARGDKSGDIARLQKSEDSGAEELTTKEMLQKELPPNYMQAKFTITLAEERMAAAKDQGRDTGEAARFLERAREAFDAKDYEGALKLGVRSRRSADGEEIEAAPPSGPAGTAAPAVEVPKAAGRACPSCGAELLRGDTFCRKCGVKVERPTACATCGSPLREVDDFCRKCGSPIA